MPVNHLIVGLCSLALNRRGCMSCPFQAREQGVPVGSGLLVAAEAADVDKLPVIEMRNPTLYSLLPPQEVSICRIRSVFV